MRISRVLPLAAALLWCAAPARDAHAGMTLFEQETDGKTSPRATSRLVFSPDSRLVIALGTGGTELFAAPGFKSVGRLEAPDLRQSFDASFSLDGKLVAITGMHELFVFSLPTRALVGKVSVVRGGMTHQLLGAGFAADSRTLMAVSMESYAVFRVDGKVTPVAQTDLIGKLRGMNFAHFTPDGRRLLLPRDGKFVYFDVTDPMAAKIVATMEVPDVGMDHALRADGRQLVANGKGGAHVINPETGSQLFIWPLVGCCVSHFAYGGGAKGGGPLALTSTEKGPLTVVVDSRDGKELARVAGRTDNPPALGFSPDGRWLAAVEGGALPNGHRYARAWVEAWENLPKTPPRGSPRWDEAWGTPAGIAARKQREAEEAARLRLAADAETARQRHEAEEKDRAARTAAEANMKQRVKATTAFRKALQVGDTTNCGLVVEVKPPITKIQTPWGEHWLKITQIYPEGIAGCRFVNGVYQEP